jgi:hypothetical protein
LAMARCAGHDLFLFDLECIYSGEYTFEEVKEITKGPQPFPDLRTLL